jgi:fatty-acyl-CoA synthase
MPAIGGAARTTEVVKDGWMHTGIFATIDADGYCNIVGRAKDMLIPGGENVHPLQGLRACRSSMSMAG